MGVSDPGGGAREGEEGGARGGGRKQRGLMTGEWRPW